ncbi:hypothetical protein [Flavobacterium alkalisoli]|uniref:hypothetical protein n=1 Tax=Flavobacterium alkalisoli TaxID=2602769 RepID=UPI003A8E5399
MVSGISVEEAQRRLQLLERKKQLEAREKLIKYLPHKYAYKLYHFQQEFIEATEKYCFATCANQIGKSTAQHLKWVTMSTDTELRDKLWPVRKPSLFMFLYPDRKTILREWKTKILPYVMPQGPYKDHPIYGWEAEMDGKWLNAIHWNSGTTTNFATYNQDVHSLQSSSPNVIFCDEELAWHLFPELNLRLASPFLGFTQFNMVATPTKGQVEVKDIMDGRAMNGPQTRIIRASMYDCIKYADGSPSPWTEEKIKAIEATLTPKQIELRVHGQFIMADGLKYPTWDRNKHIIPYRTLPKNWQYVAGIDYGSGNGTSEGHPSAISIIAHNPDYSKFVNVMMWRGDGIDTTCEDVILQYISMTRKLDRPVSRAFYDWASKDLHTHAIRLGLSVEKANKDSAHGESTFNALLKNDSFHVMQKEDDEHPEKLAREMEGLTQDAPKRKAKDDLIDSNKYILSSLPVKLNIKVHEDYVPPKAKLIKNSRTIYDDDPDLFGDLTDELEEEIDEWNEFYGN